MRLVCSLLLLACACGNLSNEDVAFLEALPQKGTLHVSVPAGSIAQNVCLIGPDDIWSFAKPAGDNINQGVDNILTLVDAIRAVPPTTRDPDQRTWGPFPDNNHAGVDVQVTMFRELDANGVPWRWIYTIAERRPPGAFLPILEGEFFGAQAKNGIGRITVHFENTWTLGFNNPKDPHAPPNAPARFFYDLSGDPRTISLDVTAGVGLGLERFDYGWAGYADGHGRFDYAIPQANGCTLEVTAFFIATGAGRDVYRRRCPLFTYGDIVLCRDVSGCLTYLNDPFGFRLECHGAPCILGNPASCAQ
jgi:hypothetical protein